MPCPYLMQLEKRKRVQGQVYVPTVEVDGGVDL